VNIIRVPLHLLRDSAQPRDLVQANVDMLRASIEQVGLIQPIRVRPSSLIVRGLGESGYQIVAGHHRAAACRALGWSEIDAIVDTAEHLQAELMEIDENLCRAELTASQRASAIKRRRQIWEALHPETATTCRGLGGRGKTEFASETAAVSGDGVRDIQRHLSRADALGDDLERIAGTSLDKGVELDALKAMHEPERKELIDRAAAGEKVSARAQQVRDAEEEKPKQSSVASLADYLDRLSREIPAAMGCRSLEALGSVLDSAVCPDEDWTALEAALGKFGAVLDCVGYRVFSDSAA